MFFKNGNLRVKTYSSTNNHASVHELNSETAHHSGNNGA